MMKRATRKSRTTTKKKASVKKRKGTRAAAVKKQANAAKKRAVARGVTTKERAPTKKRTTARRSAAEKATSRALELENLFESAQAKLVETWEKEVNVAIKTVDGLRTKLERAAEKQRKLKDKRVAAATVYRQKRNETTRTRLEDAKLAYTEAAAAVVELRSQMESARTHMKAAKLSLARAVTRDKVLARFAKEQEKAQEAKTKGTRRRTRRSPGRPKEAVSVTVPSDSDTVEKASDSIRAHAASEH